MKDKIYHLDFWKEGKLHTGYVKVNSLAFSLPGKTFNEVLFHACMQPKIFINRKEGEIHGTEILLQKM